ncbi:hypothetical protein [Aquamicrobium soli]|jgi:hypothetical protein|uniref:Uncharacterized protein n=1 Tax=Aquamicrobium soli TaxID=1811518 RepID=A0ABV7K3G1_9HYPH
MRYRHRCPEYSRGGNAGTGKLFEAVERFKCDAIMPKVDVLRRANALASITSAAATSPGEPVPSLQGDLASISTLSTSALLYENKYRTLRAKLAFKIAAALGRAESYLSRP